MNMSKHKKEPPAACAAFLPSTHLKPLAIERQLPQRAVFQHRLERVIYGPDPRHALRDPLLPPLLVLLRVLLQRRRDNVVGLLLGVLVHLVVRCRPLLVVHGAHPPVVHEGALDYPLEG